MGIAGRNDFDEYDKCIPSMQIECNYGKNSNQGECQMRKFETGATRNKSENKLAYSRFLSPEVIHRYCQYLHKHRRQKDGSLRDPDNWKKGIPEDVYLESLLRHNIDVWRLCYGMEVLDPDTNKRVDLEDLLCAVMFNSMGFLYEILKRKKMEKK